VSTVWQPADRPPFPEADTLFLLDPRDEPTVLAEGGRLAEAYTDYFAAPRAVLVPGPSGRMAIASPAAVYPVDGLLPVDQFTVTLSARGPVHEPTRLAAFGRHLVIEADRAGVAAAWLPASLRVALPVVLGEAWECLAVTWDGTTLTLLARGQAASASGHDHAAPNPVSGRDGGLVVLDRAGPEVADLHVSRFARTLGQPLVHHGPTVEVDLAAPLGRDHPPYAAGVLGLYTGYRYGADGIVPDVGTSIRDAQFRACAEAGMALARFGGMVSATRVDPDGGYDFSLIDEKLKPLHDLGVAFHITLDYNHPLTGGTDDLRSLSTPPNDPERYAELASAVAAHLKANYRVVSLAFWNEPDIEDYWTGTAEEFHALWRAVQRRFMADHPDLLLATGDFAHAANTIAHLEDIAAHGLPVAAACMHTYAQDLDQVRADVQAIRAAADRLGFPGLPIRLPEWGMDILANQERYDQPRSVVAAWPNRFKNSHSAAYAVAFLAEVLDADAGVDLTTFSSIGAVDHGYLPVSAWTISDEALFNSEDPPRPYPSFAALALLWKLRGARVAAVSNWPSVRALATVDAAAGRAAVVLGSYRPWRPWERVPLALVWRGLPERFGWRLWQMDDSMAADGRAALVGSGDEADLPLGVDLGVVGVAGLELWWT
jgi:hypothetical protein